MNSILSLTTIALIAGAASVPPVYSAVLAPPPQASSSGKEVVVGETGSADLQAIIDAAPPYSVVNLSDERPQLIENPPLVIRKPIRLVGLRASLPPGLKGAELILVESEHVTIEDFDLKGNVDTTGSGDGRASLIRVRRPGFRIENGCLSDASGNGILIEGFDQTDRQAVPPAAVVFDGGLVRGIVGRNNARDVISIDGNNHGIRNLVVENIRCYGSSLRGAVEVSDGSDNIVVRNIYAEQSLYAVDWQEHEGNTTPNRNVLFENVMAVDCRHIVRTHNHSRIHSNLTLRRLTGIRCSEPIRITNVDGVTLSEVSILDQTTGSHEITRVDPAETDDEIRAMRRGFFGNPIHIRNSGRVAIRDISIENSDFNGTALLLADCDSVSVNGFELLGRVEGITVGIGYRISKKRHFAGLGLENISVRTVDGAGILLEKKGDGPTFSDLSIGSGMWGTVVDQLTVR